MPARQPDKVPGQRVGLLRPDHCSCRVWRRGIDPGQSIGPDCQPEQIAEVLNQTSIACPMIDTMTAGGAFVFDQGLNLGWCFDLFPLVVATGMGGDGLAAVGDADMFVCVSANTVSGRPTWV